MPLCKLQCPTCRRPLKKAYDHVMRCAAGHTFRREVGIWRMLPRLNHYAPFLAEYETIRRAEGRGSPHAAHYRALPYPADTHPQAAAWAVRAQSYEALLRHLIPPEPARLLDLGAGSGWLAYRLGQRGHHTAAVDLSVSPLDGLGAVRHYTPPPEAHQAEFTALPFADGCAQLAIFNASFHYTADALGALREALRVSASVIIMDTPVYRQAATGESMVAERHATFEARYGFRSDVLPMINYLTWAHIDELAAATGQPLRVVWPVGAVRRAFRRLRVALSPGRPPAEFPLLCFG
jgi:SAM-dependent methyltransferase